MLSEQAKAALDDIAENINLAIGFVGDLDFSAFRNDIRTVYAVVRCLEIISEASRRLPPEMKARHSAIAWANMASAGNFYRHEYGNVATPRVWEAVKHDLPSLRAVILLEISLG